jgi:GNAT superfamily N-acetyltransferase
VRLEAGGRSFTAAPTAPGDRAELLDAFRDIVAADEGYPQAPDASVEADEFEDYWLTPARVSIVVRADDDGAFAGAFTIKPNGVGRAAHVGNAGYFVVPAFRGIGLGETLVTHSFDVARAAGFDALQFNFVFESNPARRMYERLGFELVGRVPEVIGGEAVCIYWRRL